MALMVGISGVRGLVGESLTPELVLQFAQAYGTLLAGGRLVLARDSRPSGELYAHAAAAGLIATGCDVTDLGIAMTPTVGRAIRAGGFAGGVSITASHNPAEWNGVKFLDELGVAPEPGLAARIAEIRASGRFRMAKQDFAPLRTGDDAGPEHARAVHGALEVDLAPLKGTAVVLDCINGAGCLHSPAFLKALGLDVAVVNGAPTGLFAHRPEPVADNLTDLGRVVREQGAAVGFAQDPDADRLAVVDEHGTYIGEEYTLALATWSVLSRRPGPVAANLSTSRLIDDVAGRYGVPVFRTPVGEAHVARAMLREKCVVGGEGNGGVIDPRICYVRDSLSAMSLVLQLMAATGKGVSRLVAELPRYASVKQKFPCARPAIEAAIDKMVRSFSDRQPNTADGVRIDFPEGWVHVRASNTEPIIRVIAEAREARTAERLVAEVRGVAGLPQP